MRDVLMWVNVLSRLTTGVVVDAVVGTLVLGFVLGPWGAALGAVAGATIGCLYARDKWAEARRAWAAMAPTGAGVPPTR